MQESCARFLQHSRKSYKILQHIARSCSKLQECKKNDLFLEDLALQERFCWVVRGCWWGKYPKDLVISTKLTLVYESSMISVAKAWRPSNKYSFISCVKITFKHENLRLNSSPTGLLRCILPYLCVIIHRIRSFPLKTSKNVITSAVRLVDDWKQNGEQFIVYIRVICSVPSIYPFVSLIICQ